jgi:KDO2-lipid IV(A) lauroyltransferase
MVAFVIYKLGALLAQSLSLPTARKVAHVVGRLMCFVQRRNRRNLLRNLEVAFGNERSRRELKRLRRAIFSNFAVFVAEFLRMPLVTRDNVVEYLRPGGTESFDRLASYASKQTPAIAVTAHLGNWEFGAATMGLLAGPITILVDAHPSNRVTRFFDSRRVDKGVDVVPVTAFHRCFRSLKKGHLVAIVGDRPVTGQGIRVSYFGREALMPDGHAALARRFKARLVPCFLVMRDDGLYDFHVEEPVTPRVTDDFEADVRDTVERLARLYEGFVRRFPEQWYVFRPIWEREGEAKVDRSELREMRTVGTT